MNFRAEVVIEPDPVDARFSVEVRSSILEATDGPMLRHGLHRIHRSSIYVPAAKSQKPDAVALEERYERFLASG